MFDIGFTEIMVILVVALVVIGPERLPVVARSLGQWWGRIQNYLSKVKREINKSIELEALREMERKMKEEASAFERSLEQVGRDIEHEMRQLERELERPVEEAGKHQLPSGNNTPFPHRP